MLIALAFAHFSSELLLKEQMIIPVKKKLNNAGHIHAKLIDFSEICPKKSSEIGYFLLIVSWQSFPRNFPWNWLIFLRICPWKSFEIWLFPLKSREIKRSSGEFWLFSRENPAKSADFSANLPLKIPRNFAFFSAKYQKPWIAKQNKSFPKDAKKITSPSFSLYKKIWAPK